MISPDDHDLLLIHHEAFGLWIQPGGHLDPADTSLRNAALRELSEETAMTAISSPEWAPGILDLDIHRVPADIKGQPAHLHFDIRFAFRAHSRSVQAGSDARDVGWFPLDSLDTPTTDASVRRAIRRILTLRS